MQDVVLEHFAYLLCYILGYRLMPFLDFGGLYYIALAVGNILHNIGSKQLALVGNSGTGRKHLYRGYLEVLTEGCDRKVGQIHSAHAVMLEEVVAALAGKVYACFLRHTKGYIIFIELFSAQHIAHLHECGVARVAQRRLKVLLSVSSAEPAGYRA